MALNGRFTIFRLRCCYTFVHENTALNVRFTILRFFVILNERQPGAPKTMVVCSVCRKTFSKRVFQIYHKSKCPGSCQCFKNSQFRIFRHSEFLYFCHCAFTYFHNSAFCSFHIFIVLYFYNSLFS